MAAGDIWQLSVDQTLFGVALTNVHTFRQIDADTDADMGVGLISAYQNNIRTEQLACQGNDLTLDQFRAIRLHPVPTQTTLVLDGSNGARLAPALSANIVALGSMSALPSPASHVAKFFLSGLIETDVEQGLWDAAARILLETFVDALIAVILSPGGTSFERVAWNAATTTARKVLVREIRSSSRKLKSRTRS